jgi:ubiquinone/menaquinone biosynthesis C-methylase UbiE
MPDNGMQASWDARAREDPFFYVETAHWRGDVDEFFSLGEERARMFLDPVLERHPPGRRGLALDLGCGVGRFSRPLLKRFERVVAVDVSSEMVRKARELHPADEWPGLEFRASDGRSLPVDSSSVDFVFSYEVFQHMPTKEVIRLNLREVSRVLDTDGISFVHLDVTTLGPIGMLKKAMPATAHRILNRVRDRRDRRLESDRAWHGTNLRQSEIPVMLDGVGLQLLEIVPDPTHSLGTRVFSVARGRSG